MKKTLRHFAFCAFLLAALFAAAPLHAAVPVLDTYYSPKNGERPLRTSTKFIILHTTEGAARGSGSKLKKNGEAHYMVDEAGRIYRIIDRRRVAYHCGRSMWNGLSSLDSHSIGIEVVGYHNKDLTAAQCDALKKLLAELKQVFKVPDDKVLTHSMVAYGAPNQWHKRSHRGRKRCGMRMALPSVRKKLGLNSKPSYDPDVKAGRLVVADKALQQVLYSVEKKPAPARRPSPQKPAAPAISSPAGARRQTERNAKAGDGELMIGVGQSAWDVARGAYNARTTLYIFPDGTRRRGDEIKNWKAIHSGTRVIIDYKEPPAAAAKPPQPARPAAPAPRPAAPAAAPAEEALDEASAVSAYNAQEAAGNVIGPGKTAWDIARDAYAAATTVYEFPNGERKHGNEIRNWKAIPSGTRVTIADGDVNEPEPIATLEEAVHASPHDAEQAAAASDSASQVSGAVVAAPAAAPDTGPAAAPGPTPPQAPGEAAAPAATAQAPDGGAQAPDGGAAAPDAPAGPSFAASSATTAALAAIAGAEWNSERTLYITEKGRIVKGSEINAETITLLTPKTKVLSGYKVGGPVTARNPAFAICGPIWRDEGTQFLFPDGHMEPGDKIDPRKIPPNTMILYKD